MEDPKSLESPTTPTTEDFIHAQVQQRLQLSSEDSDGDNQSMVTVRENDFEDTLVLNPTDPDDYVNANVFVKFTPGIIEGRPPSTLQTIVEVVNPMLSGDGTATEITVGRTNDESLTSFDIDDDDHDGVVYRREMSLNDKMKNVLKELRENEKVRLSLSRSMDDEDEDEPSTEDASASYEEKQGAIGTVFMVRERLINDFYDHQSVETSEVTATVFANPNVEFLENEIRHVEDSLKARKETLTLNLNQQSIDDQENDEPDEDEDSSTATPTTPTKLGPSVVGSKKKRKKNKNKKK